MKSVLRKATRKKTQKNNVKEQQSIPLTQGAFDDYLKKRSRLIQQRVEVMARLKEAREQGDLSENAAYKYAKFELGSIGRQVKEISSILDRAYVSEISNSNTIISFGSVITLRAKKSGQEFTYQLLSGHEANPLAQTVSMDSPIGKAVMGKQIGDVVSVVTPMGIIDYSIISVT